jgi:putative ABC transport system permease protein
VGFQAICIFGYFYFLSWFIRTGNFYFRATTKEFGIRKVLGASAGSLFSLLSKEFLLLVFIALLISTPLAWLTMNKWLQDYEYRVDVSWWVFVFAGVLAILIALLTVSFQAIKTAVANPVKSLRTE